MRETVTAAKEVGGHHVGSLAACLHTSQLMYCFAVSRLAIKDLKRGSELGGTAFHLLHLVY